MEEREVELIDYLNVLWRWKWFIVLGTLGCVLVTAIVTWQRPGVYIVGSTIDTGDLSEERSKDVERLVARLNGTPLVEGPAGADSVMLAVEYRKPFVIALRTETQSPTQAARALERVAATVVAELDRMLQAQRGEDEAKASGIRLRMEGVNREVESVLTELRADLEHRFRTLRVQLASGEAQLGRIKDGRAVLGRRVEASTRNLEELRRARAEALRYAGEPGQALVAVHLSNEVVSKESELATLERELVVQLPAQIEELEGKRQMLREQVAALEAARAALQDRRPGSLSEKGTARRTLYRAALAGALELKAADGAMRKVEFELSEQLGTLKQQADALGRKIASTRSARILMAPDVPRVPVKPRMKLNLAVAFVAGLFGSSLMASLVDYVRQGRARADRTGPGGSR